MNVFGSFADWKNCFPLPNGIMGSFTAWKIQTGCGDIFEKYVLGSIEVEKRIGSPVYPSLIAESSIPQSDVDIPTYPAKSGSTPAATAA